MLFTGVFYRLKILLVYFIVDDVLVARARLELQLVEFPGEIIEVCWSHQEGDDVSLGPGVESDGLDAVGILRWREVQAVTLEILVVVAASHHHLAASHLNSNRFVILSWNISSLQEISVYPAGNQPWWCVVFSTSMWVIRSLISGATISRACSSLRFLSPAVGLQDPVW